MEYNPATRPCSKGSTVGARTLMAATLAFFPPAYNLGIWVCRDNAAGAPSVHGNGRAGDDGFDKALDPAGFELAQWLVDNHVALDVQLVIWAHRIWSLPHASEGWRPYGCDKPGSQLDHHTTHVHWELNNHGGATLTRSRIDAVSPHHAPPAPPPIPEDFDDMKLAQRNDDIGGNKGKWYKLGDYRRFIADDPTLDELKNQGIPVIKGGVSGRFLDSAFPPLEDPRDV